MDKLNITNLTLLKFKKIKSYKVTFLYDDREFILLERDSTEDCGMDLFERIKVADNRYKLEHISGVITIDSPIDYIKDISKKKVKHPTYSNIDREFFIKKLTAEGLIDSIYTNKYKTMIKEERRLREIISKLTAQVHDTNKRYYNTSNRGSKCYGYELKAEKAERIKGRKPGEPSKQYHDMRLGQYNKAYNNGLIVDLFNLPVGTAYECTCGHYTARIVADEHGDKCVQTDVNTIKLTPEHSESCIKLYDKELEQKLMYRT